jgi:acetoin utilization deacetylase AcuC-like enzyme
VDEADLGWDRAESPEVELPRLEAVHPSAYVDAIERLCRSGGGWIDADTVVSEGSWEAALHGAGGAVEMVSLLCSGAVPVAFSIHRPPGHHAEAARAMGFCLFNNVAVAAQAARDAFGLSRVLVLDWDVHHGNGTNDIFHSTDGVLFCSIHQSPLYPGTGAASDVGAGPGEGYTINMPVPAGSGDEVFSSLVAHVVVPVALQYAPQLVLVSAGFDAHRDDPLASCRVTEAGFAAMTRVIRRLALDLDVPVGFVLEGGYDLRALGSSVVTVMEACGMEGGVPDVPVAPLASAARERLSRWWPGAG